ncbi:hypothetical protein D3C75_701590 [compost metagenome]
MRQYWMKSLMIHEEIKKKTNELAKLPKELSLGRSFQLSTEAAMALGQIYYSVQSYSEAEEILKLGLSEQLTGVKDQLIEPQGRVLARYYLASLIKQGKHDNALYSKLISLDSSEQSSIQSLINM